MSHVLSGRICLLQMDVTLPVIHTIHGVSGDTVRRVGEYIRAHLTVLFVPLDWYGWHWSYGKWVFESGYWEWRTNEDPWTWLYDGEYWEWGFHGWYTALGAWTGYWGWGTCNLRAYVSACQQFYFLLN